MSLTMRQNEFKILGRKKARDLSMITWCHISLLALVRRLSAECFVKGGNVNGLFTHFYCQQCCLKKTLSFLTVKTYQTYQKIETWGVKKANQDSRKKKDYSLLNNSLLMSCFPVGFGEAAKCRVACERRRWWHKEKEIEIILFFIYRYILDG